MLYNHFMKKIKIKICGQRNLAIIDNSLNLGIDYQGLIFYKKSPRNVDIETLSGISKSFNKYSEKFFGVFVNPSLDEISKKLEIFNFGSIQLHGSENQNLIDQIKAKFNKPIIKSITPEDFKNKTINNISYYLIESGPLSDQMPGGNNQTWNWSNFKNLNNNPFILSGGLNSSNIKNAINLTGANFVDINSGVEIEKGEKSITLIEEIVSLIHSKENG